MRTIGFCFPLSVAIFGFSMSSSVQAGVATEVIEQAGKAVARAVAGEAAETGAKAAAKQALKKATQEAVEAGAKRAASRASTVVDDIVTKGGVGDNVADFAWRNKGVIAGGAAVATLVANPETTMASGASMFNASVDSAAKHVVGPAVSSMGGVLWGIAAVGLLAVVGAAICYDALHKQRLKFLWIGLGKGLAAVAKKRRRSGPESNTNRNAERFAK